MSDVDALLGFLPRLARRRVLSSPTVTADAEHVESVVLAADVSGFTSLALSLTQTPGGVDELRSILNRAFRGLIEVIEEAGGDVLGFGGDALVAIWPADSESAAAAGWAALEAQRRLASGDHRVSVRLGLSVGPATLWTVGGEADAWFITIGGPAPAEAAALQESAPLGGVVVSAAFAAQAGPTVETAQTDGCLRLVSVADPPAPVLRSPGAALDATALARLRRFAPAAVVDRVLAGHGDYLSEVRTISAVMLRSPERRLGELEGLQEVTRLVQVVADRHGAHLEIGVDEKGITFMLAFGMMSRAHEDDADRAVAAALALQHGLTSRGIGHALGVATGQAFCGTLGDDVRRAYGVLSNAPCVAARLAGAALAPERPDLLVDGSTVAGVGSGWTFDAPVSLRLKGRSELFTAFAQPQRVAGRVRTGVRTIGRSALCEEVCDLATSSPGQLVLVEGEAGIGKSQLLGDVEDELRAHGTRVLVGCADSLEQAAPWQAWRGVFRELMGPVTSRGGPTPSPHVTTLLERAGPRAPLLSAVLAEDIADNDTTRSLTGEPRLAATQGLLAELLAESARDAGRVVVILEDAHWFDSASRGLLADVLGAGISLVVSSRPAPAGLPDPAAGLPPCSRIILDALSAEEVASLAAARAGAESVEESLATLLLETSQGNPFFLVELVRTLQEAGALRVEGGSVRLTDDRALEMPRSVQAAITSRIDRLPAAEELTLKVASVIGRSFSAVLVRGIHPAGPSEEDLTAHLDTLVQRGFLVSGGDDRHEFHHALTREVVYGLLLGEQRRSLHRAVAECYENGDVAQHHHALAHHWRHAEVDDKAVHYLSLAAGDSMAIGMPGEATTLGVAAAALMGVSLETDAEIIRTTLPHELAEINRLMAGRRPRHLAQLPTLVDEQIGAGIGLVLQTMAAAHQSAQSELFALMATRNLNLTLRFGSGPLAPGVFVMYATVLRGLGSDPELASEFSDLARTVNEAVEGDHLTPMVEFVHVWFHHHWQNPLSSSIPIALAGADTGFAVGDLLYASFNLAASTTILAYSGAPLSEVIATGEQHTRRIGRHSATASFHSRLETQVAKALSGATDGLASLSDDDVTEEDLAAMVDSENHNQAAYFHVAKLRLAYLDGDLGTALDHAERAYALLPSFAGQFAQVELTILSALAQLGDLPRGGALRGAALDDVRTKCSALHLWAERCPHNFAHLASLLRGELAAAEGYPGPAQVAFAESVAAAELAGFAQWAALACERAAHAALATGDGDAAQHLAEAVRRYQAWGATRKAAQLERLAPA